MKRGIGIALVVVIIAAGVFAGRRLLSANRTAADAVAPAESETAIIKRGDIEITVDATGTIEPLEIVAVNSTASGKILELNVEEGDYVKADDVIARVETKYVQADVDRAQANLAVSRARVAQAETNLQIETEQVEINITRAKAALDEALRRRDQLAEQIETDKATNARNLGQAQNSLRIAQLRLRLLTSAAVREEEIKRAKSSVEQAESNRDLAQSELERKQALHQQGFLSASELDSARAQAKSAQAQYESSVEQLAIVTQPASATQYEITQVEVEQAQYSVAAAQEQIDAEDQRDMELELQDLRVAQAREALKLAEVSRAQVGLRGKDIETAKAQRQQSEVDVAFANEQLEDTIIKAPISGTILEKVVEEGQVIRSSLSAIGASEGTTIVRMADLSQIYIVSQIDETDIGKIAVGQPVEITVDAYPDRTFSGEVVRVAPQGLEVQNVTVFEVIVSLTAPSGGANGPSRPAWMPGAAPGGGVPFAGGPPSGPTGAAGASPGTTGANWGDFFGGIMGKPPATPPAGGSAASPGKETAAADTPLLKPGMNASIVVNAVSKKQVLLIPHEAVSSRGTRKFAQVVGADGTPEMRPIRTGVSDFESSEVVFGLNEGDVVLTASRPAVTDEGFERFRQMMNNPASTMRRMQGTGGPPPGGAPR